MDDVDQHLLSLLRENARASVASLAKTMRVARGTVQKSPSSRGQRHDRRLHRRLTADRSQPHRRADDDRRRGNAADAVIRAAATRRSDPTPPTALDIVAELRRQPEAFDRVLGIRPIEGTPTQTSLLLSTHVVNAPAS
jgi:hypothetical protein